MTMMKQLMKRVDELVLYLNPIMPLLDSHMVSFITEDLWDRFVPSDIKLEYEKHNSTEIFDLFSNENCPSKNYHLQNFLKNSRKMYPEFNSSCLHYDVDSFKRRLTQLGCSLSNSLPFDKFMCPKKTHEVEIMSDLIAAICRLTDVDHLVDIGDGKGYLSSVLALENKVKILGIDSSSMRSQGAAKRVEKMFKHWKGVRRKLEGADDINMSTEGVVYKQHTVYVKEDTDLTSIVRSHFPTDAPIELGIVGLHTCGSLSSTCLKHFVANSHFQFIVNVGCCHHLIDPDDFPMSSFLKNKSFGLSRNAKMLSLQPMWRIMNSGHIRCEPLKYRAVFEDMMDNVFGLKGREKPDVGRISSKCSNFVQYVKKACKKLNLPLTLSDEEIEDYRRNFNGCDYKLEFYFQLRMSLAPIIENIIFLDRILYLVESGFNHSYLVRMFDPVVSPRNYGVIAIRLNT